MKKAIWILMLCILSLSVFAVPPNSFTGFADMSGTLVSDGTLIEGYIGGTSRGLANTGQIWQTGYFNLNVPCVSGENISFYINGIDSGTSDLCDYSNGGAHIYNGSPYLNISIAGLLANGQSCTLSSSCLSNICSGGFCSAGSTPSSGGGGGSSSCTPIYSYNYWSDCQCVDESNTYCYQYRDYTILNSCSRTYKKPPIISQSCEYVAPVVTSPEPEPESEPEPEPVVIDVIPSDDGTNVDMGANKGGFSGFLNATKTWIGDTSQAVYEWGKVNYWYPLLFLLLILAILIIMKVARKKGVKQGMAEFAEMHPYDFTNIKQKLGKFNQQYSRDLEEDIVNDLLQVPQNEEGARIYESYQGILNKWMNFYYGK